MKHASALVVVLMLATVARAAPSSKAAIRADYDVLCNSPSRSGADKEKDQHQRLHKILKFINENLKTPEVKAFFGKLGDGSLAPDETGPALKKAAKAAGYDGKCPLADAK
jgi:hypothetical protein